MEDDRLGSHTVWDCKYHLVWTTTYRYPVVEGEVGQLCRELLREIAHSLERVMYAGSINRGHVHMLIETFSNVSVSRAMQYLKGKRSHQLLSEYVHPRKPYWRQHLSARRYWVATSSNVTDEVRKQYIEEQKPQPVSRWSFHKRMIIQQEGQS